MVGLFGFRIQKSPVRRVLSFWALKKKKILFVYVLLAVLGLHCCSGFSLVVASGLLIAVVSLAASRGL